MITPLIYAQASSYRMTWRINPSQQGINQNTPRLLRTGITELFHQLDSQGDSLNFATAQDSLPLKIRYRSKFANAQISLPLR